MEKARGHVVLLPYPEQGHINPLIQFAKCLVSKGIKATFATTHYTSDFIHADGIDVRKISDGYDNGGCKHAPGVEAYLESFKIVGSRTLTELILQLNESNSSPVNCIIHDTMLPWAIDVAKNLGTYTVAFWTNLASICPLFMQIRSGVLTLPVPLEKFPLSLSGLPPLGIDDVPSVIAQPTHHSTYLAVVMDQFWRLEEDDYFFANTFEALESEAIAEILPVQMVGPMVPSAYLNKQIVTDREYGGSLRKTIGDNYLNWLDTKPPKSVVFVSFGSVAEIDVKQTEEIAWGLKASNHHFLWIVRDSEQNKLPIQFLESIDEMGLILPWCNQLEVLANQAVGCFITHCGWNSTIEAISLGVPMVAIPQLFDQPMNAKFVEDFWRVGVRVKKDEGGIVRREEIARCIREVMVGDKCEEFRANASIWREHAKRAVCRGGSSDNNINKFVELLMEGKGKHT